MLEAITAIVIVFVIAAALDYRNGHREGLEFVERWLGGGKADSPTPAASPPACQPIPHHTPVLSPAPDQPGGVVQPVQMGSGAHYSITVPGPVVYPADGQDPKQ